MKTTFRALVSLSFFLHAIGLFVIPLMPSLFSTDTLELMKYSGHGASVNVSHPAILGLYLLSFPALACLFFFLRIGRVLLLLFISLVGLGTFFFGASVSGPPETFVSFAASLTDGAIIALMLCSPVKEMFDQSPRRKSS